MTPPLITRFVVRHEGYLLYWRIDNSRLSWTCVGEMAGNLQPYIATSQLIRSADKG